MPSTRRRLLTFGGASLLPLIGGCTAKSIIDGPDTSTTPETNNSAVNQEVRFEVRLEGPDTDQLLFEGSDIESVGSVEQAQSGGYALPVVLSDNGTEEFAEIFIDANVDESPDQYQIVIYNDGVDIRRFGISSGVEQEIADEDWKGKFVMKFESREQAVEIRELLTNGRS